MDKVLLAILLLDGFVLIGAILLQAGTGGGLASLGGGGGTDSTVMGGRQAVTLLTRVTWWGSGIFLSLSLILSLMSAGGTGPRSLQGVVPAPAPVQSSPLPFQAPQQAAPAPAAPSQAPNR